MEMVIEPSVVNQVQGGSEWVGESGPRSGKDGVHVLRASSYTHRLVFVWTADSVPQFFRLLFIVLYSLLLSLHSALKQSLGPR